MPLQNPTVPQPMAMSARATQLARLEQMIARADEFLDYAAGVGAAVGGGENDGGQSSQHVTVIARDAG